DDLHRQKEQRQKRREQLAPRAALIAESASSIGIELTMREAISMADGATLNVAGRRYRANHDGSLSAVQPDHLHKSLELLARVERLRRIS
ncbi:hypothetical protein DMW53_25890, partial [Serratia marcescens]